jgi:hypothetical protein
VLASNVRVWLATGTTGMRRGTNSLALQVQQGLQRDPPPGLLRLAAILGLAGGAQNVKSARDTGALAEQIRMVAGTRNHLDLLLVG